MVHQVAPLANKERSTSLTWLVQQGATHDACVAGLCNVAWYIGWVSMQLAEAALAVPSEAGFPSCQWW
jgi:hypothetical protein